MYRESRLKWLYIFIFFSANTIASENNCVHTVADMNCVSYVKNYDADTITFNIGGLHPIIGKNISIRVKGVDAPEIRSKNHCEKNKALTAKRAVASFLEKAERVDLRDIERGKYFRIVADVIVDDRSLADYLLKNRLAYKYDGGTKKNIDWCEDLNGEF